MDNFDCEAGLANTARSRQCHQPDGSARQKINRTRGFLLAPKKAGKHRRQSSLYRIHLERRSGADLFEKRHGFNGGRKAKFGCQHMAAGFVNIQCGASPIRAPARASIDSKRRGEIKNETGHEPVSFFISPYYTP
jgi:hypothetical protein